MNVLITGASGFLGKECVSQFRADGHTVFTTDCAGSADYLGDLSDRDFVARLPSVEVVVNCAAVQYVSANLPLLFRKRYFLKNNIQSAGNLVERYSSPGVHFVHVGTSMMYRQTGQQSYAPGDEMSGSGVYSDSKLRAQGYVGNLQSSATIIPCIIGGKGREGLFVGFVGMMKKYGVAVVPGSGNVQTNMVHVEDVASLILRVVNNKAVGMFNAGAPEPLTVRGWIREIEKELGLKPVRVISIPLKLISVLSQITGYRLLAREQILMLTYPHVLCVNGSLGIGWMPKHTNTKIVRDIARYISDKVG